ncbi:YeeE/YedE family protein [Alcaligenaceae bacterium]|nr:YeeE/YedE family protein [Alcaligenaceae bacterium]
MTISSTLALPTPRHLLRINALPLVVSLVLLVAGALYLNDNISGKHAALWVVGALLGVTLYHSAFGFTQAWRVFVADRQGAGLRAQMMMLAFGVILFFPFLAQGSLGGQAVGGFIAPPGLSVVLGAFIFGIGMQLGGGCASGTLFAVGGGNTRMVVTLFFFIVGSVLALFTFPWWSSLPAMKPTSLVKSWGLWPALLSNLAVFAAIAWFSIKLEKRRHGKLISSTTHSKAGHSLLRGSWPLAWGAIALVLLNFATLAISGRPWGIMSAFGLWGSKGLIALDTMIDPSEWEYWERDLMPLMDPISHDITSVMDIGLILGALAAAAIAGKFSPVWKIPLPSLLGAIVGGILLGFGSRLAYGCNIGAYFSGMLSGSLHAWIWLPAAFAGSAIGVRLRPWFGLQVETTPPPSSC